jgi:hypothetical protein
MVKGPNHTQPKQQPTSELIDMWYINRQIMEMNMSSEEYELDSRQLPPDQSFRQIPTFFIKRLQSTRDFVYSRYFPATGSTRMRLLPVSLEKNQKYEELSYA